MTEREYRAMVGREVAADNGYWDQDDHEWATFSGPYAGDNPDVEHKGVETSAPAYLVGFCPECWEIHSMRDCEIERRAVAGVEVDVYTCNRTGVTLERSGF